LDPGKFGFGQGAGSKWAWSTGVSLCASDAGAVSRPVPIASSAIANGMARPPRFRASQPHPLAAKSQGFKPCSVETRCGAFVKSHLRRLSREMLCFYSELTQRRSKSREMLDRSVCATHHHPRPAPNAHKTRDLLHPGRREMSDVQAEAQGQVRFGENIEVITDPEQVKGLLPSITVRATRPGTGDDDIFVVKINQPSGRALLIAVHL